MSLAPSPVPRPELTLVCGDAVVDLRARALVAGVVPPPRWARESEVLASVAAVRAAGADLADVSLAPRLVGPAARRGGLPVSTLAASVADVHAAGAAGATLVLVPPAVASEVVESGEARVQVAVVIDELAGLEVARRVADGLGVPLALDTAGWPAADALAGESVALSRGCRIVRTADVRRTRRVVEVVAALIGARRGP